MSAPSVRRILRSLANRLSGGAPSSIGLQPIEGAVSESLSTGWQNQSIALRQQTAFASVLQNLREGKVRQDFRALAAAVDNTQTTNPTVLEIGSGSGWNAEVLSLLLKRPVRYIGMDYSQAMIDLGRRSYPTLEFAVGDATQLPFASASCDVLIFGTVLMHLSDYAGAIAEGRRVTRQWGVFHTVPTLKGSTQTFQKLAYGVPVVEIVFGEAELLELFRRNGFSVQEMFDSLPHPYLNKALQQTVAVRTFLCKTF